ncbi:hypothetical protein LCGC14_0632160 [marine sediment metagenome]|uniref:Uncharacterized protein n=1 Tax=marine sediment metagenome TaxID=412755 RepID=A0A0F9TN32_9ZZZZ
MGLPIGAVAGGAAIGGVGDVLSGVITGFVPQLPSWAVKAAAALGIMQYGGRFVGKEIAQLGGLFLTYDAVQELFNIRLSVANIVGGLTGRVIAHSPPAFTGAGPGSESNNGNVSDYYPGVARRSG